jgi:hypothetical protein
MVNLDLVTESNMVNAGHEIDILVSSFGDTGTSVATNDPF